MVRVLPYLVWLGELGFHLLLSSQIAGCFGDWQVQTCCLSCLKSSHQMAQNLAASKLQNPVWIQAWFLPPRTGLARENGHQIFFQLFAWLLT